MRWILGALLGLMIAYAIYGTVGALCNFMIGPLLGYRIQKVLFFGGAISRENSKMKFEAAEFRLIPEVLLDSKVKQKWKKLILDVAPVAVGFCAGAVLSCVFGGVRVIWRHVLIGTLSAMAILYCWHIFIVLKMMVYMRENTEE